MGEINVEHVTKNYTAGVRALDDVSITVEDGEFLVLVGPSGCGKSTLLRVIAGLEDLTHGTVRIGGHDVTHRAPRDRDIAMVFQNYSLYPHLTVAANLAYGLKMRKTPKEKIKRRVADVAQLLHLEELLDRRPAQLSGGQRQRVAMGRAIVREPQAFLMDEPLSNLDAKLRVSMRASLTQLHSRLGVTTVYVTHDQIEAMTLGQRVAVLWDGRLQQIDRPQALYRAPHNLFVATFIGSPAMNIVEARVAGGYAIFGDNRIPLSNQRCPAVSEGQTVVLGIRPESFEDGAFAHESLPRLGVRVSVVEETGADAHLIFPIDAPPLALQQLRAAGSDEDESLLGETTALFTARVNPLTSARRGERIELAVDPKQLYFFDPESGANLLGEPDTATPLGPPLEVLDSGS